MLDNHSSYNLKLIRSNNFKQQNLEDAILWLARLWVALAIVKTLMGYYQMPMMIRVLKKTSHRDLTRFEIFQMILLSPLVNLFTVPVYILKEKIYFFQPYEESYVEKRFSEL